MSYIASVALVVATCPSFGGCFRPDFSVKRSFVSGAESQTKQFCGLALFSQLGIESTLGDARSMLLDRCRENFPADQCRSSIGELWQDRDLASTVFPATASEFCQTLRFAVAASEKSSLLAEGKEKHARLDRSVWMKPDPIGLETPGSWRCKGGTQYAQRVRLIEVDVDAQCGWSQCQTKCLETHGCSRITVKQAGDKVKCTWPMYQKEGVYETSTVPEEDGVSSACEFVEDPKAPTFRCMRNADAGGPHVAGPDSPQDCRYVCREDPDCRYATFDTDDSIGGCFLGSSTASITRSFNGVTGVGPNVTLCEKIVQPSSPEPQMIALGLHANGSWTCEAGKEYYFPSKRLMTPHEGGWCDGECKAHAMQDCQKACLVTPGCTKFHLEDDAHGGLHCFAASCASQIGDPPPDAVHLFTACEFVKS